MPHRVANFFRSSNDGIGLKPSGSWPRHPLGLRRGSSQSSITSSSNEDTEHANENAANTQVKIKHKKMHHYDIDYFKMHMHPKKPRRMSWSFGKSHAREAQAAGLDWKIESPPIMFHDDPDHSTGALLSGQLLLEVREDTLELDMFEATLKVHVRQKKPFMAHCDECANQYTELKKWKFLSHPVILPKGTHQFPFSVLLEGHLPASMDTPLMSIQYEFMAEAIVAENPTSSSSSITPIKFERIIDVKRSLPESDMPHHSVRVFPPTNIKAGAHYCQVLHPTGRNTLSMRLDGLTQKRPADNTIEFWKLKKITWRLEEQIRTIAPACDKHTPGGVSPSRSGGPRKGVERVEKHTLGEDSRTGGWKADYSPSGDGSVEFELDFAISHKRHGHGADVRRYAGDSRSRDGTQVTHNLMVELVVSREWAPAARPELCTQTGMGRILRMHYRVVVTEQSGLSVSWDNECPPLYQDVPPSPPTYPVDEEPIDYDSLEPLEAERSSIEGSHLGDSQGDGRVRRYDTN